MADILEMPNSWMNLAKGLGLGLQNYQQNFNSAQDRKLKQDQDALQTFMTLMPYLQGGATPPQMGGAPAMPQNPVPNMINPDGFNMIPGMGPGMQSGQSNPFAPPNPPTPMPAGAGTPFNPGNGTPQSIQDIVARLTGVSGARIGPSAAMRRDTTEADVAARTADNRVTASGQAVTQGNQAITQGALDITGKQQANVKGAYENEIQPVGDKQKYIATEAPNYVANVGLPATEQNRTKLIEGAYAGFMKAAPVTRFKTQVTKADFAGAVDAAIADEKKYQLDAMQARAAAVRASTNGQPDYLKAASELRLNINNRLQELKNHKNFTVFSDMSIDMSKYPEMQALQQEYNDLTNRSNGLQNVMVDVMRNGGGISREGIKILGGMLDGNTGTGTTPPPAVDEETQIANRLRGRPPVEIEAAIRRAEANGLKPEQAAKIRSLIRSNK